MVLLQTFRLPFCGRICKFETIRLTNVSLFVNKMYCILAYRTLQASWCPTLELLRILRFVVALAKPIGESGASLQPSTVVFQASDTRKNKWAKSQNLKQASNLNKGLRNVSWNTGNKWSLPATGTGTSIIAQSGSGSISKQKKILWLYFKVKKWKNR
jgi:hypothetical protein